ncbi:hypothetical protein ASPWEDRAFT_29065 [Aspergillus wentii DTO 134E9]|uniref:Uncharacterized protein n=1 Tax=Aspergillus wentii DTO 134E9 TaxID=1073089 RepID=A0A1L9RG16_ASPWE|nr:uncharacterized protein ASPWEDRAFT_29065 [Aspergillus wentii DTO 134E9]OJJ33872.1 hypothetical protein ASPWEDRAFT_29065 [Aspergillus wentii DTO 134E9]
MPALLPRQTSPDCPSSITGGGIAGIVVGTIAGTLLILWLLRLCADPQVRSGDVSDWKTRRSTFRRRERPAYGAFLEKPRRERKRARARGYRDEVRRPAKVYLS